MHFRCICLSKSFSSGFVQTFAPLHFSPDKASVLQVPFSVDVSEKIAQPARRFEFDFGITTMTTLGVDVSLSGLMPLEPALHLRCQDSGAKRP